MRTAQPRAHLMFLLAIGLGGWATILWSTMGAAWPSPGAAALFLAMILGARLLAFPLGDLARVEGGGARFSVEAAILVAGAACVGAPVISLGAGLMLAGDSLWRDLRARSSRGRRAGLSVLAYALYFGGLSGGLLALWALALTRASAHPELGVWAVPLVGVGLLLSHGLAQVLQLRLSGQTLSAAVRRTATGMAAEATLLPLASAMVLLWSPGRLAPFVLLAGTYLFVNYGFNRLAHFAAALHRRVLELETLNRTAHAAGASLDLAELVPAILRETARALPGAVRLQAVIQVPPPPGSVGLQQAAAPSSLTAPPILERYLLGADGAIERAPADERARALAETSSPVCQELVQDPARPRVRSSVSVPIVVHGEVIGALEAESSSPAAFGDDALRLLDAISGQAAAAAENARLYALANVDGLTGLYCRRYFDTRVAEEIERARRFGSSFALVMLDLDNFKRLNDTLGHPVGDRALKAVALIASGQLRGVDLAARFGGEELAFLLPRTSLIDAHAVAERIREAIAAYRSVEGGALLSLTASLGVAGWAESGVLDPSSLLARADAALYRAKTAGKNRVEVDLANFELTPSLAPVRRRA